MTENSGFVYLPGGTRVSAAKLAELMRHFSQCDDRSVREYTGEKILVGNHRVTIDFAVDSIHHVVACPAAQTEFPDLVGNEPSYSTDFKEYIVPNEAAQPPLPSLLDFGTATEQDIRLDYNDAHYSVDALIRRIQEDTSLLGIHVNSELVRGAYRVLTVLDMQVDAGCTVDFDEVTDSTYFVIGDRAYQTCDVIHIMCIDPDLQVWDQGYRLEAGDDTQPSDYVEEFEPTPAYSLSTSGGDGPRHARRTGTGLTELPDTYTDGQSFEHYQGDPNEGYENELIASAMDELGTPLLTKAQCLYGATILTLTWGLTAFGIVGIGYKQYHDVIAFLIGIAVVGSLLITLATAALGALCANKWGIAPKIEPELAGQQPMWLAGATISCGLLALADLVSLL